MLVIPALATLIYAAFTRFTRTPDFKGNRIIQRLQEEKQANDCVLREFDQDEQNSAEKYDCTDDPSIFPAASASEETSKLGTSLQPGINFRDNDVGGMSWDHSKDFQPIHSDGLQRRRFSIEKACMTVDWLSEHLADGPEHLDHTPRNVGRHYNWGTDVAENSMAYSSAETGTSLLDCNIVYTSSNIIDHAECSPRMNNPKYNGGVAEENSVPIALTGPTADLSAFAELLDEGIEENKSSKLHVSEENKSSKFHVSEENGMLSISETELLLGSYAVKNTELCLGNPGFSVCSQETEKEDAAGDVCFVRVRPDLTFLSSPEFVVESNKYASKKESCELSTQDENEIVVNSEEEAFVVSTDEQCSETPGFFLHAQDSNTMMETPADVDVAAVSPEPNYPAPMESLTHAPYDVDLKGGETSNRHLLEQMGQEFLLDPFVVDSYEDTFATLKLLSHSEAAKMTEVPGEDLHESLDKGASNHQNDVAISSDYGGNTDNMSVWLITESNIIEAVQGGQETRRALSDPIHHSSSSNSHSLSKVINDEAYSSNSHSYFSYANSVEDKAPLASHGGYSESEGGMNFAFLDTPILLNEASNAESWTDNAGCSRYIRDNASAKSLHDGNHVQTKTSERAKFVLEESLISLDEGIKSEIFSLYSRSSSCVSDVQHD